MHFLRASRNRAVPIILVSYVWIGDVKNQTTDLVEQRDSETAAAVATARAEVEAAYVVALRRPRDIENVRLRVLGSCKRKRFAQSALYSKPVGSKAITGLSIRAAEELIRQMGNIRISVICTYEDETVRRVKVGATDLETNAGFSQEITIQKTVERKNASGREVLSSRKNSYGDFVHVVRATDDEMLTKEAAMVSKIIRNHGLRLMPGDILEEVLDQVQATLKSKGADTKADADKILEAFHDYGIMPADIRNYFGGPIKSLSAADVQELRSMFVAIKDGEAKWADFVAAKAEDKAKSDGVEKPVRRRGRRQGSKNKPKTVAPHNTEPVEPDAVEPPKEDEPDPDLLNVL